MRRAKIVATLGPATASAEAVLELVEAGMDKSAIEKDIATSVKVTTCLLSRVHLCVP